MSHASRGSPYPTHPMTLRSARKTSEPPNEPQPRSLTSALIEASRKPELLAHQWSPEHPLDAVPLEDTFLELVPPNPFQDVFNANSVAYGVQWELERKLRSLPSSAGISVDDVSPDDVLLLAGPAVDAMTRIPYLIRDIYQRESGEEDEPPLHFSRRVAAWAEMDREEAVISDSTKVFDGLFNSSTEWPYGGRLMYAIGIRYNKNR